MVQRKQSHLVEWLLIVAIIAVVAFIWMHARNRPSHPTPAPASQATPQVLPAPPPIKPVQVP